MFEDLHELLEDLQKAKMILVGEITLKQYSINTVNLRKLWGKLQSIFGITHFSVKNTKKLNSLSPKEAHIEIANILGYNATKIQLLDNIKNLEDLNSTMNKAINRHLSEISKLKTDLVDLTCKHQLIVSDLFKMNNLNTDLNNKIDSLPDNCDHYDQCSESAIENYTPDQDPNN